MFARMRFILAALALVVSACATAPPSQPSETPAAHTPAGASRLGQYLNSAGRADAPSRAEIERAFGAPDIIRQDGAGAALTYRLETCALLLVFAADARNELRLAEAHPSARRAGAPSPSLETCAAEIEVRR